ncbi:Hypothetical protein A7982_06783 [Minicystis rosea]|nr:Hypothetical protein A7982_06783 [Minicystis rosea]
MDQAHGGCGTGSHHVSRTYNKAASTPRGGCSSPANAPGDRPHPPRGSRNVSVVW